MNQDLSEDLWRTETINDDSSHSEAFQLDQKMSETELN